MLSIGNVYVREDVTNQPQLVIHNIIIYLLANKLFISRYNQIELVTNQKVTDKACFASFKLRNVILRSKLILTNMGQRHVKYHSNNSHNIER